MLNHITTSLEQGNRFAIPVPALAEFLFGIGQLPRATQNQAIWNNLAKHFDYYSATPADAVSSAKLRIHLRKRGWQLATVDALIAVIALRYDLVLLTTDKDFSAIPGLAIENWLAD